MVRLLGGGGVFATAAVSGKKIGNLKLTLVLEYRVKSKRF